MKKLNQMSGMPQMDFAFANWLNLISIIKVTQNVVDGFVEDTSEVIIFKGAIQPLKPNLIQLKPEGQRAFEWLQIHCFASSLNLVPNDRIIWQENKYKVMAQNDYSLNNYIEYHVIKDYE